MSKHDVPRVHDRLDAARKALLFAEGQTRSDFESNEVLVLALVRLLEIVGEAARYIPEEITLVHEYLSGLHERATKAHPGLEPESDNLSQSFGGGCRWLRVG